MVLKGDTNIKYLQENGVRKFGTNGPIEMAILGPVYGHQ